MYMTAADPATSTTPAPASVAPDRLTLTVTIAGLFDVLTNTIRAVGTDVTLPSLSRVRLDVADGRLHATATDQYRLHRDWTPLLDNQPARLPEPLLILAEDITALRTLLRRKRIAALREEPITLTVTPPYDDDSPYRLVWLSTTSTRYGLSASTASCVPVILHSLDDPTLLFPDLAALDARTPGWSETGAISLNPRFLTDAARLTHHGRPVSRHAGLTLRFRADHTPGRHAAVRITHPGRPSWTADVMPIHHHAR